MSGDRREMKQQNCYIEYAIRNKNVPNLIQGIDDLLNSLYKDEPIGFSNELLIKDYGLQLDLLYILAHAIL